MAPFTLNSGNRRTVAVSFLPSSFIPQVPITQEAGLAPEPVWTYSEAEKLLPLP